MNIGPTTDCCMAQARDALDIYKKFLIRMDRVSDFLKVAEVISFVCCCNIFRDRVADRAWIMIHHAYLLKYQDIGNT